MTPELAPHELCIHCMQTLQGKTTCPHCGHSNRQYKPHPLYLKPYTLLQEQYVIGKSIGQGGFGITYIGLDVWLKKRVAIKEYVPSALATRDFISAAILPIRQQEAEYQKGLTSFLHEAQNLAKFDHPNIVHVHNFFEENQTGYMVMDYLEGQSLIDILMESKGRLMVNQTLDIMLPILDALSEVHAQHIYHRDISPHNIYILTDGTPMLIDFGAARHIVGENSRSLDLVLKHGYSPIEQYSGKGKIGAWTDIYACGALMYVMLRGTLPPAATDRFYDDTLVSLAEFPELEIPQPIIQTINRALQIKSEQRFQSVAAFKAALLGQPLPEEQPKSRGFYSRPVFWLLSLIFTILLSIVWINWITKPDPIFELQQQAQHYFQQQQIPQAYSSYQAILNQVPTNSIAQQQLQKIADYYQQQTQQAINTEQIETANMLIGQGLALFPDDKVLLDFQQQIHNQQQAETQQQIEQLLQQAQQQIDQQKYQVAYETYQSILAIQENNNQVQIGIDTIEQYYIAESQNKNLTTTQRTHLVKTALTLFPNHRQLLALEKTLQAQKTKQQQIQQRLDTAQKQLQSLYLTEPDNNNAYDSYRAVLDMDSGNTQALAGLEKIVQAYAKLAKSEKNTAKSLQFVQKGLKVMPNHTILLNLKNTLQARLSEQTVQNLIIEEPKQALSDPITTTENTVDSLLNQAQQQVVQQQYQAAYQTYQSVLQQQASHSTALAGLEQIKQQYTLSVQQQLKQQNINQAQLSVQQGLALFPSDASLLKLQDQLRATTEQQEISDQLPSDTTAPAPVNPKSEPTIIFTPSF